MNKPGAFSEPVPRRSISNGWHAQGANHFHLLRLLLAVVVIYSHARPLLLGLDHLEFVGTILHDQKDQADDHAIDCGHMAVYAFFVVSGFLISMSWSRTGNLVGFLRKRVLRIYPAFVASMACSALLFAPLGTGNASAYWAELGRHLLPILGDTLNLTAHWQAPPYTQTLVANPYPFVVNGSIWTIRYEFQCYLLVACLGVVGSWLHQRIPRSFYRAAPVGLFLCIYTLYIGRLHGHFGRWDALEQNPYTAWLFRGGNNIPRLFVYFAAGMSFYAYRRRLWFNTPALLAAILLLAASAAVPGALPCTLPVLGPYLLMAVMFAPWLKFHRFGTQQDFSYGVYLYGFPIQQLLVMHFGSHLTPATEMLAALPLTFGCAWLSWHLIEKPALSLKGRATHAPDSTAPAPVAGSSA